MLSSAAVGTDGDASARARAKKNATDRAKNSGLFGSTLDSLNTKNLIDAHCRLNASRSRR
jgi:hypothetical protein